METINETTYTENSVEIAKRGIEKYLLNNSLKINNKLTKEIYFYQNNFYDANKNIISNFSSEEALCDAIIKILIDIHDKWVIDNAKKYDRDKNENDKRLFQHLPTALIGINEISKDLIFLAPILEKFGYLTGKNDKYGSFTPSISIENAFQRYVKKYKIENNIKTKIDLEQHIACITKIYNALDDKFYSNENREFAQKRNEYMQSNNRIKLLTNHIIEKNSKLF